MFISFIRKIRARLMRVIKSKDKYVLFSSTRSLYPISEKFGYDRGSPIDRYYIEKFLSENADYIRGVGMEIVDDTYLKRFGGKKVTKRVVLDLNDSNPKATIVGNLKNLTMVKDETFDCIVLTQTLGMIDDYDAAVSECYRILKKGGTLLYTGSLLSPVRDFPTFWRFTPLSIEMILSRYFEPKNVRTHSYGNILSAQAYLVGLAREELLDEELDHNDPHFPIIVTGIATK